jgi:hypothetical protein
MFERLLESKSINELGRICDFEALAIFGPGYEVIG